MSDTFTVSATLTDERRMHGGRVASIDVFRGLTMAVMIFGSNLVVRI
jgi:hypothetical protein